MKKTILSSLLMMVAISVMAATPTTWTNVVTVKLTDGNSDTYTSRFGEATELTDQPSWGAAVANLEGATVRAYTVLNGVNYEKLYLQSMENTALVVKTYNSTSLSFELKANYGTITLYDKLTGNTKTVDKAGVAGLVTDTYDCTVETNATIEGRFFLFYNAAHFYKVTTNAYGFCSFASNEAVEFLGGLKAYKGDFNPATYELTLTEVGTKVPAGTGVILWNSAETAETFYYNVGVDASAADVTGNDFVGAVAATPVAGISADAIYCLHGNQLMKYVGTDDIPAGKAYLPISVGGGSNNAPKHIVMRFNGTTAVDNVEAESVKAEKFVEDGQVYIRRGNEVFNLQGQIVK